MQSICMNGYQKFECKTIDGIINPKIVLRSRGSSAHCYHDSWCKNRTHADAVVLCPMDSQEIQFNCVKEILLPEIAERFQSAGYNAVIYDPRSIGDSDGLTRNNINPLQQAEDLAGTCNS